MGMTREDQSIFGRKFDELIKEQKKTNALLRKQNKFKHYMTTMVETSDGACWYGCSCGMDFNSTRGIREHIEEMDK